jgi:hypothetical protein
MAWQERRYSSWLLEHEERLHHRHTGVQRAAIALAVAVALAEALLPWESITPDIPAWAHIAVAAIALPLLYFMYLGDYRRKLQAFGVAMSDRGRRLLFLDPFLEPEEFELQERMQGAHLLPLQRSIDTALKSGATTSLHSRVAFYFRALPHPVCEGDRMGLLSILHPATALSWGAALAFNWAFIANYGFLKIGASHGLSALPVLLLLYLFACRANSRFAFEAALYDWLRLG